jgi:hypothetical protein
MLDATPHAAPPDSSQASHGMFELGEAGQLEKANADKSGTRHIMQTCQDNYDAFIKQLEKKHRKAFLGIF